MTGDGYVKIYESILMSSIWAEPAPTRCVWLAMLASCDQHGQVKASFSGLCRLANVSADECKVAIQTLQEPDLDSKSPEWGGRRIEKIDGGWVILNYLKYREMRSPKQIADAERQARVRARQQIEGADVTDRDVTETHSEVSPAVDEAASASAAVPATSKEEAADARPVVGRVDRFLKAHKFGRWQQIVEGYLRASRKPINIVAHLELHLAGEMGYKKAPPEIIGFALNQYAGSNAEGWIAVLFDGFVRKAPRQLDRNVTAGQRDIEDRSIAEERRLKEERERDDRDRKLLVDFETANPDRFAELRRKAEAEVDKRYKGDTRTEMVRGSLIALIRAERGR